MLTDEFISYIKGVRRYSPRTCVIYEEALKEFTDYLADGGTALEDSRLLKALTPDTLRNYEVELLDSRHLDPRTANLHISVLSSFCKYLLGRGLIASNPAKLVTRPKVAKRIPEFYRKESMDSYFRETEYFSGREALEEYIAIVESGQCGESATKMAGSFYNKRLFRLIISIFYQTGIRRAELLGLTVSSVDFKRSKLTVTGKGDKMREIPLTPSLCEEISLYLKAADTMAGRVRTENEPLLVSEKGNALYPVFIDRVIKGELGQTDGITGRKSPHVLRHTLATELLDSGADMYSIKELLGHSSLAATQVYTHNSIDKLKKVYLNAHPRAKRGGKNGD
ncbi:MAG: tyrosine-type recombinase/integrase [Candidatus Cryptobacteroides sp.]